MSISESQQLIIYYQQEEKNKKLFMKIALNSLRKYFNDKRLPYHPLIACVSIKPGCPNRSASLQSYPNQSVWLSLIELPKEIQLEITEFLIKELKGKQQKFSKNFLIEAQERIRRNFDFQSFYKEPTKNEIIQNENELDFFDRDCNKPEDDGTKIKQKKWSKGEDFVSESKQISIQMTLCNQHPPLIKVNKVHYQKMKSLLEKIKEQKFKQSEEMKIFTEELEKFMQKIPTEDQPRSKLKIQKIQNKKEQHKDNDESSQKLQPIKEEVKVEDNSAQEFLDQFKMKVKQIEPGIVMFLPEYQKIAPQYHQFYKNLEDSYFKDLYFQVRTEEIVLNPQNILKLLRQTIQNPNFVIPNVQVNNMFQQ